MHALAAAPADLTKPLATWLTGKSARVDFSQSAEQYNAAVTNRAFVRAATALEEYLRAGDGDTAAKQLVVHVIPAALAQLEYATGTKKTEGVQLARDIVGNAMATLADLEGAGFSYAAWRQYVPPAVFLLILLSIWYINRKR